MNHEYRILIENQVLQLDEMQRNITLMRSALMSRLETVTPTVAPVAPVATVTPTVTPTVATVAPVRRTRRTRRTITAEAEAQAEAERAVARAVAEAEALRDSGAPAITIRVTHNVTAEAQAEAERAVAREVAERVQGAPVRYRPMRVPIAYLADHRVRMLQDRRRRIEENRVNRRLRLDWERVATEQEYFKIKTVNTEEFESILPDVCGICLENHKMKETVICSCNHVFGKECFNGWRNNCINNHKPAVSCPTCREPVKNETTYISTPHNISQLQSPEIIIVE